MGYGPRRLDMYCTVFFLVFTWHGMPTHLCAHSIGPCSWTPTAARPWQEVVFLLLFQCISRVGVGWGMLTFLVSGTQRNWRVGLGWGGVGHALTFMWTCGERKCFSVAAGRWIYAREGWGGACINIHVNLRRTDMLLCGYCTFSGTFHACVMLRYCKFSGTFHSYMRYIRHAALL